MTRKINFINPFGTTVYDGLIRETLLHYAMDGTEVDVTHLEGCPDDMDYFYPNHVVETALFEAVRKSEEQGYQAVISGCCYDPGVLTARELDSIPVIDPMHASIQKMGYFGRTAVIVTDHFRASTHMRDNIRLYGATDYILGLDVIDWYVCDMIKDTDAVAQDVIDVSRKAVERTGAECVILNCTIIAASYQRYLMNGGKPSEVPILNPNLMALMMAEPLAHLYQKGAYHISRLEYYGQPKVQHFKGVTEQTRAAWQAVTPDLAKALANPNYCIGSIQ